MMQLVIRQSGGASIVSLPKVVLKTLGLDFGSALTLSIVDQKIVLEPAYIKKTTLHDLLVGSPQHHFMLNDEDRAWMTMKPKGKEIE